jgi:hypothetical protein
MGWAIGHASHEVASSVTLDRCLAYAASTSTATGIPPAQRVRHRPQREADHHEAVAVDRLDQPPALALKRVRPALSIDSPVRRYASISPSSVAHRDRGGFAPDLIGAAWSKHRDRCHDAVGASAEHRQHAARIVEIDRLAEDDVVEHHDRVAADDHGMGD